MNEAKYARALQRRQLTYTTGGRGAGGLVALSKLADAGDAVGAELVDDIGQQVLELCGTQQCPTHCA